jgi:hypothetical protein
MKKTPRKMSLNRETLRLLDARNLANAAGGTYPDPPSQVSCVAKICPADPGPTERSSCCANA